MLPLIAMITSTTGYFGVRDVLVCFANEYQGSGPSHTKVLEDGVTNLGICFMAGFSRHFAGFFFYFYTSK